MSKEVYDYRIESLASIFAKQAEVGDKIIKMQRDDLSDPEKELVTPFNLARALSVMAYEIEKLKLKL